MSGIDWAAVAKNLGELGVAAGNAKSLGGMYPGADLSQNPYVGGGATTKAQADAEENIRYHSGAQPGGALFQQGQSLLAPLKLPANHGAADTFSWEIKNINGRSTLTQMTLAGALSWLRNLSVNDKQGYNDIVAALVRAKYLSPSDARYNSYTSTVAQKFLQSAVDTEATNNDNGRGGIVKTWWNHMEDLFQGNEDSGQINPDGSSGSGSGGGGGSKAVATRTDVFTSPDDVKAAINDAARSVLGRHLTDAEVAQFASAFHGQEQTYNDQRYAQQVANVNNQTSAPAAVQAPSPSSAAQNYVDTAGGSVGDDRTRQLLGSYIGVLRNMTGLGSGGVSRAVS